ncbi:MAG: hypothetical protein EOO82_02250 [Oxalobacteraceae bacterium]|nr:MAG: hypothetical protein EOO82_02250 [Oxalobacteraceae bacterium]
MKGDGEVVVAAMGRVEAEIAARAPMSDRSVEALAIVDESVSMFVIALPISLDVEEPGGVT